MKPLDQYAIPIRPLVVIERRIKRQLEGGFLAGLRYDREGTLKPTGATDLPFLQPLMFSYEEVLWGGAGKDTQRRGNTPVRTEGTLELLVCAQRVFGFFDNGDREPEAGIPNDLMGAYEWLEKVKDSIETSKSGDGDAFLHRTVMEPVTYTVRENYMSDLTLALLLEVKVITMGSVRGQRSP